MIEGRAMTDRLESRRQLLKWLAASPLLACPGLAGLVRTRKLFV